MDRVGFLAEAFFQADGLGAELNFVGAVSFGTSAFVFDGYDVSALVDFDDVADTAKAMCVGPDWKAASYTNSGASLALAGVCFFM